jgi:acyl-CoA synthetase (AMP-forming)/AMP-acid ligase II
VRRAYVVDVGDERARGVGAAVVLKAGDVRRDPSEIDQNDMAREAKERLSSFKVPSRWALVTDDDVPRTATGKVDKDGLRKLIEAVPLERGV